MKLKFFKPDKPQVNKEQLYKKSLQAACIELVVEGNFRTYAQARAEMIRRAKNNMAASHHSKNTNNKR